MSRGVTCLVWLLASISVPAQAQNPFGELFEAMGNAIAPRRVQPAQVTDIAKIDAPRGFKNQFTPFLDKILTRELHFVQKVCDPSEEEFQKIHLAGRRSVERISKHLAQIEQRGQSSQWPDPRSLVSDSLLAEIAGMLSAEVTEHYRREIEARNKAARRAANAMMVAQIDEIVLLLPGQYDDLTAVLDEKWDQDWDSVLSRLNYPQYMQLPSATVFSHLLDEQQRRVWGLTPSRPPVRFGWQMELGFQNNIMDNGHELPEFPDPSPKPVESLVEDGVAGQEVAQ